MFAFQFGIRYRFSITFSLPNTCAYNRRTGLAEFYV